MIAAQVADVVQEAALLDAAGDTTRHRRGDLVGQRDVHRDRVDRQPELVVDAFGDEVPEFFRQLDLAPLEVDHAETGFHDHVRERQCDDTPQQLGDLLHVHLAVGADHLAKKYVGFSHPNDTQTVGPHLDHGEIGVAHGDRVGGTPAKVGDRPGVDEVHLGPEGAVEPVLPALQGAQEGEVLGGELVVARTEPIGELPAVDENSLLTFTDDELGAVLDLVVVARKPPGQRGARIIDPFDDVDEFTLDLADDPHNRCSPRGVA